MGRSRGTWSSAVVVVGVVVLVSFASGVPGGGAASRDVAQQPEADNTATRIHVYANGSARWTVQIRTRLDTDDRIDDYRAFQARFRNDTSRFLDPFRDRIRSVVAAAGNATGREMAAVGFAASTHIQEVPRRWGIVTYEFTWGGFAVRENGAVAVGDVFEGGFFLAANDTLTMEAPAGYTVSAVDPGPAEREPRAVTWVGREDFSDGRPRARFVPIAGATDTRSPATRADTTAGGDRTTPTGTDDSIAGWWLVVGGILVLLAAGGGYLLWRRDRLPPGGDGGDDASASAAAGVTTDADRVRELLEANGGRMRQADIRDELGWSSSKTSRVLSDMADEGDVEKLRLGRENVIDFAEE